MEVKCSCSACNSFACPKKQHPLCIYGNRKADETFLFFNKIDKNVNTFSFDDYKLKQKVNDDCNDEIDVFIDQDSEKLTETPSAAFCEDNLKDRHDNFFYATNSRNTLRPSAVKLSAQIMNVPFKDLEGSLYRHEQILQTNLSKLTLFDIFEKIKEVYKACSCKVCECIVGKAHKNKMCKCKPCECVECESFKKKVTISNNFTSLDITKVESGCLRVKKSLYKEYAKQEFKRKCDCKPCECAECTKKAAAQCSCEQCRCTECKARYTNNKYQKLVVASVESDSQSHQDCMCNPCNCAECSHHYGLSSNLRHEMSTEISRPEGCHCEACLNEACLPDGANTCSCERRQRIMRKPVQRDTDYDIHRSIISQQNPCRHGLIAMFGAVSKIYPQCNSEVKKCECDQCECLFCNYKNDCVNTIKTSDNASGNNRNMHDAETYKSQPNNREFAPRKSSLKTTKATECSIERPSEIKAISKFLSNNTCRWNLNESIDFNMMATCTGDDCDCRHCKCGRCVSSDEIIYPIKKGEVLTPAIFKNKMNKSFITFCDKQDDFGHKSLSKKVRTSSLGGHDESVLPNNGLVEVSDEHPHDNHPRIELQPSKKVSKQSKKDCKIDSTNSTNVTRVSTRSKALVFQAPNYNTVANKLLSNYMNSESNSLTSDKLQTKRCNNSDYDNSNYLIKLPKKATTYLSDNHYLDKFTDIRDKKLNVLSKNNTANVNVSLNLHTRYPNKFDIYDTTSKSVMDTERNPWKLSHDEYFVENDNVPSFNESSHCIIVGGNKSSVRGMARTKSNDKIDLSQIDKQNKVLISKMKENIAEDWKRSIYYSKSAEIFHKDISEIDSKTSVNTKKSIITNNVNLDEDYERVQKTIKDARAFSQCLVKLLEKYEKANREFESIYCKLAHSNKTYMVNHMVSIQQNVSHVTNESVITRIEDFSKKCTTLDSYNNVLTKESNVTNIKSGLKINLESTQLSDFLTDDIDMIRDNGSITEFSQSSSKPEKVNKVQSCRRIKPKPDKISNESVCNSSCNNDSLTEFNFDSSNTYSFNNSDVIDNSIHCDQILYPINETNVPTNIQLNHPVKRRFIKKKSKQYMKMYKQAVVVSKRRNFFAPTFAKCSIASDILNNIDDRIYESDQELTNDDESKLSIVDNECIADENVQVITDDSTTTDILEPQTTIPHHKMSIAEEKNFMNKSPSNTEHANSNETYNRISGNEVLVGVYRKHSLGKGIKEAVNAIKQASMTWESNYAKDHQATEGRHENAALMRLHSEVKKLLEMPLLQKCHVHEVGCNETLDADKVHKCESLKVNFLTVRKISDTSIAVKWQIPKVLRNVLGYEVLVNGRAMKKVDDNMSYESVVSGVPSSDKILVTVRTVTKRPCSSGHNPTATVVYKPRSCGFPPDSTVQTHRCQLQSRV